MIVYTLLAITLLTALYTLYRLWHIRNVPLKNSWDRIVALLALCSTIYLYGTWIYLSVYAKYIYGSLVLLMLVVQFLKKKAAAKRSRGIVVVNVLFALVFAGLSTLYFTGTTGKPDIVALSFPLKTGKYFILQGGKGLPSNFFHYSYRGAVYAIDIVKLNAAGNRANHIFSSELEDYEIFGDTIYSPCDGRIIKTENDNPDNIPPSRKRGPTNTNQVVIETDSFYVFMAHLKMGSVLVKPDQHIVKGQPLALVGNSGFTLEPHLHIQVHQNDHSGNPWYMGKPLYIAFDGRTYLLFETIKPRHVNMIDK